jgi:hypothetical protein
MGQGEGLSGADGLRAEKVASAIQPWGFICQAVSECSEPPLHTQSLCPSCWLHSLRLVLAMGMRL